MVSFDVFDTLITRKTVTPDGIFLLIEEKLRNNPKYFSINSYVRENFRSLRRMAEVLVRYPEEQQGKDDITLRQIYAGISMCGCISEADTDTLYHLECETELENVLPIAANIRKVKDYIRQGERVVLISDMYLETEAVSAMLAKADPLLGTLPLYVSSAYRKAKWSGRLYSLVAEAENVTYGEWEHFGDSQGSDVDVPARLGIRAHLLCQEPLAECEKYLLEQEGESCAVQLQAGAARYARISRQYDVKGAGAVGCSFGGEVLLPYVLWIIRQCREMHVRRLYFIARDGYLLKKMADSVIAYRGLELETFYIYSSRRAWRVPAMACPEYEWNLTEFIRWSHVEKIRTVADLAGKFELPAEEFVRFLPPYYRENSRHVFNSYELKLLAAVLQQDEAFRAFFREFHKDRRERVRRYLQENIDTSDEDFAFVEIGGSGLTQDYLSVLLQNVHRGKIGTFYFKFDRVVKSGWCDFYAFMPSIFVTNRLIEMVCRAPHEQTVDYVQVDGRMVPEFQGNETKALLEHGFREFEEGIMGMAEAYLENTLDWDETLLEKVENNNLPSVHLMKYAGECPDTLLMDYLADMPTSETGKNDVREEVFAPRLSGRDIRNIFWKTDGRDMGAWYKGSDLEYSMKRCSPEEQKYAERIREFRKMAVRRGYLKLQHDSSPERSTEELVRRVVRNLKGNVSVYGAGKYGKLLVGEIRKSRDIRLLHWWDRDAYALREQGYDVETFEGNRDFGGLVLIAVADKKVVCGIYDMLTKNGCKKEKILPLIRDIGSIARTGSNCWEYERIFAEEDL